MSTFACFENGHGCVNTLLELEGKVKIPCGMSPYNEEASPREGRA